MKDKIKNFLISLNPNKYNEVKSVTYKQIISQFFFNLIILSVIFLFLMYITLSSSSLSNDFDNAINNININLEIEQNSPLVIYKNPKIILDTTKENMTDENILINNKEIKLKQKFLFFNIYEKQIPLSNYENIKKYDNGIIKILKTLIFLSVPALVILYSLLNILKYLILVIIAIILSIIFCMINRRSYNFEKIIKSSLISIIIVMLFDYILTPFFGELIILSSLAYFAFLLTTLWIITDRDFAIKKRKSFEKASKKKKIKRKEE